MEYRKLGSSDLDVSVIGLGTNNFGNADRIPDPADSAKVIHACLDAGVNFIDTAPSYSNGTSEEHIGHGLKGRRQEAIVATKFQISKREGQSVRDRIKESTDLSLKRLQTDYVDLMQIHFPDPDVSQEEILEPMNGLVHQGKVRFIGECYYASWRHAQADAVSERNGWAKFVSAQSYYNLLRRQLELELLPFCTDNNIGFLPYFPLAGGWLTGKYSGVSEVPSTARRMVGQLQGDEAARATLGKLDAFANERGHSMVELAFAWMLARPAVSSVIAGSMNDDQVAANAKAGEWHLSAEERAAVDDIAAWDGSGEEVESYGPGMPKPRR